MLAPLLLGLAMLAKQDAAIDITGDVPHPLDLSFADLEAIPSARVSLTEHDGSKHLFEGAPIDQVLAKAGLAMADHVRGKELATYVLVNASDGYQVVFGLGELEPSVSGRTTILAYSDDGGPLKPSAGPVRLVVDGDKKEARCVRMVTSVRVVALRQ